MSITAKQPASSGTLSSLDPRARLTIWLAAAFAAWCVVEQAASFRSLVPPIGLLQAAIFAIIAVLIARGSRRALLAAPIVVALLLLYSAPFIAKDLGHPGAVVDFVWTLVALPLILSVAVAGATAWRAGRGRPGPGAGAGR